MDVKMRQNCLCGHKYSDHEGQTQDDDGMCHVRGCACENYAADPFDLGPEPRWY